MFWRKISRRLHRILGLSHRVVLRELSTLYTAGLVTINEAKILARFSLRHDGWKKEHIEKFVNGALVKHLKKLSAIGTKSSKKKKNGRKTHKRRKTRKSHTKRRRKK